METFNTALETLQQKANAAAPLAFEDFTFGGSVGSHSDEVTDALDPLAKPTLQRNGSTESTSLTPAQNRRKAQNRAA